MPGNEMKVIKKMYSYDDVLYHSLSLSVTTLHLHAKFTFSMPKKQTMVSAKDALIKWGIKPGKFGSCQ